MADKTKKHKKYLMVDYGEGLRDDHRKIEL